MKMSRHTVWWLIFLALIKYYSCASNPFVLEKNELTAMEGSCVEIKCIQPQGSYKPPNGFWFWMKDANWTNEDGFVATIIDSTNESQRPVSPLYKNRVHRFDSSPTHGNHYSSQSNELCSILICDLNKNDSGNYSFRFEGKSEADKWVTNPAANLTIKENPCPITFNSPQVVTENETVTLTCSTLSSCPSCPNISILGQLSSTHLPQSVCVPQSHTVSTMETSKNTTYTFMASWKDDGAVFSCQMPDNKDTYFIWNISLTVKYRPRSTIVISGAHNNQVKVGSSLEFTCDSKAHPEPWFSWYHVKQSEPSHWTPIGRAQRDLNLERVQREDEGCYICNATNSVGSGNISVPECINVLFPPTNVRLSMDPKVREGQFITITCTAESFPTSAFTLQGQTSNFCPPEWSLPSNDHNTVSFTFNATSAHADSYICIAANSEGSLKSEERKLVVEYSPKDVRAEARSVRDVKENDSFSLDCSAHAHPTVISYTWMKMTDGKNEILGAFTQNSYSVKSASPSHSGLYSCTAQNKIGTGVSEQVDIKVKYAPKHTTIIKGEEQQQPDGRSAVMLTCSTYCYPPAKYFWKNTTDGKKVSEKQNFTVYSHQTGEYYCVAINEMGQNVSDPIKLFDGSIMKIVKYFFLFCLISILIFLISIFYRHRWKKSVRQRTMNTWPCHGFLTWRSGASRGNTMNETGFAEPFRSRDDLLPGQPFRPNAQRCQPRPDATSASNINTVYSTVDLPHRKENPSAQKPARQQFGHMENDSLNYASLHFENKQKKPEEDTVYSKVCRPNPCKKNEQERMPVYENIIDVHVAKVPNPYDYDTSETSDTSEDEVEVSYTQVNFKSKSEQRRANSNSTSSEDETQYSQVKI